MRILYWVLTKITSLVFLVERIFVICQFALLISSSSLTIVCAWWDCANPKNVLHEYRRTMILFADHWLRFWADNFYFLRNVSNTLGYPHIKWQRFLCTSGQLSSNHSSKFTVTNKVFFACKRKSAFVFSIQHSACRALTRDGYQTILFTSNKYTSRLTPNPRYAGHAQSCGPFSLQCGIFVGI